MFGSDHFLWWSKKSSSNGSTLFHEWVVWVWNEYIGKKRKIEQQMVLLCSEIHNSIGFGRDTFRFQVYLSWLTILSKPRLTPTPYQTTGMGRERSSFVCVPNQTKIWGGGPGVMRIEYIVDNLPKLSKEKATPYKKQVCTAENCSNRKTYITYVNESTSQPNKKNMEWLYQFLFWHELKCHVSSIENCEVPNNEGSRKTL